MPHVGRVKLFSPKDGYGFIIFNGSEVFFHVSFGGRYVYTGGDEPEFVKDKFLGRTPKAGESLTFEYDTGPKGFRATRWAFLDTYEMAQADLRNHPKYRLISRSGSRDPAKLFTQGGSRTRVIWEGRNIADLVMSYPKDSYPVHDTDNSALSIEILKDGVFIPYEGDPR